MEGKTLMGIAIIGGGLLWYVSSRPPAEPLGGTDDGYVSVVNPPAGGGDTTTGGDDDADDDDTTTTTTQGSGDSSTVDPTDCSKYRKSQHEHGKVWMSSTKSKSFIDDIIGSPIHTTYSRFRPRGIKMDDFATGQQQYFINQEIDWSLKLSVKNTSKDQCGESKYLKKDLVCWIPPSKDGAAYGKDCCVRWTVTWTSPQGETYVDDSGAITRPDTKPKNGGSAWSTLNGKFRIPNVESSIGRWDVKVKYWWDGDAHGSKPSVSWEGQVFSVVPESCGQETSAAETYKADFTRPIYAPAVSVQSFMQF